MVHLQNNKNEHSEMYSIQPEEQNLCELMEYYGYKGEIGKIRFYFRVLPFWFIKRGIKKVSTTRPVIMYIHPWETHANTPRLNIPRFSKFVTYYGVNSALMKFERLVKEFEFAPIREVLGENI